MLYATDIGVDVIIAANGWIYHSAFAEAASQYAYDHGVVQTYSGDDLNTANHNYPANYGHAMLIQGVADRTPKDSATDAGDLPACVPARPPAVHARRLLRLDPAGRHVLPRRQHDPVRRQELDRDGRRDRLREHRQGRRCGGPRDQRGARTTASTLTPGRDAGDPRADRRARDRLRHQPASNVAGLGVADPGADPRRRGSRSGLSHFGWGRANLGDAVKVAAGNDVPPEAAINSPDWYSPVTGDEHPDQGTGQGPVRRQRRHFQWKLEWGAGQAPTPAGPRFATGTSTAPVTRFRHDRPGRGAHRRSLPTRRRSTRAGRSISRARAKATRSSTSSRSG